MNRSHLSFALALCLLVPLPALAGKGDPPAPEDTGDTDPKEEPKGPKGEPEEAPDREPEEEPPAVAPAPPPPPVVGFKKGFFIASPDDAFRLVLGGRIQVRFAYENLDGSPRTNEAAVYLPRMRFKFGGHLFDKRIKFKVQIDFAKGQVSLKDAFVDLKGHEMAIVRLGQFKTPHSRQFLASSTKQHFVDRAITHKAFAIDRDIGLMLQNDWKKSPFEYAVGIFNGTGDVGTWSGDVLVDPATGEGELLSAKASNVPDLPNPLVVLRVGGHTPGFDGYSESDLGVSDFGIGIGGGAYFDFDADNDDDGAMGGNIDLALKVKGLSAVGAFYLAAVQDGAAPTDLALDEVGGHVSVAYAIASKVEPALRYAAVTAIDGSGTTHEILGGLSVFFFKHNIKWVTDGGAIVEAASGSSAVDARIRTQFQLDF